MGVRDARIGRRTLIRRAVATGTAAWMTPAVVGSLASPAAAVTAPCLLYVYTVHGEADTCSGFTVQTAAQCATPPAGSVCAACAGCGTATTWTRVETNDITLLQCTYMSDPRLDITVVAPPGRTFVGWGVSTSGCAVGPIVLQPGTGTNTQQIVIYGLPDPVDVYLYFLLQ